MYKEGVYFGVPLKSRSSPAQVPLARDPFLLLPWLRVRCLALFAALRCSQFRVCPAMSTFAQLSQLPVSELKTRLEQDGVKSEELEAFCKYPSRIESCNDRENLGKDC